ncbi:MAG: dicarboxylate/amino acid:cation symporter [Acidobacteria bacterium]|nr:dicarboxylate/amino acid:cation symporter [Acidobacteriota bacterium]
MKIYTKIAIGLLAGAIVGPLVGPKIAVIEPIGQAFIKLIVMLIVPLIMASIIVGTASLGDIRKLGRIGAKTLIFYAVATALAVYFGIFLANVAKPGTGLSPEAKVQLSKQHQSELFSKMKRAERKPSLSEFLLSLIPDNPIKSMAETELLPIIFFSIFFGIGLARIEEKYRRPVVQLLEGINEVMISLIDIVIKLAPYAVFALMASVAGKFGFSILIALGKYVVVTIIGMLIFMVVVYSLVVRFLGGTKPSLFFRVVREVQMIAFSTSSSNAALPVNIKKATEELSVPKDIAAFVLPLGATMNMNGTALYQGVSVVFIAQVFGVHLSFADQLMIVLTATLAAVGTAGMPSSGFITLVIVLRMVNPALMSGLAIILGVERILDMCRTAVNVTGDAACAVYVAESERKRAARKKEAPSEA